jgi:hypothetical protein
VLCGRSFKREHNKTPLVVPRLSPHKKFITSGYNYKQ